MVNEKYKKTRFNFREIILGGQDGIVNVLGVILAVAFATQNTRTVLIAGLAAAFAESISMAAVAYTSTKAAIDYYESEVEEEKKEIKNIPEEEKQEIYEIYYNKGFRGDLLNRIVRKITSDKKLWIKTMITEELHLSKSQFGSPLKSSLIVGSSAIVGSLFPLLPFLFLGVKTAIMVSFFMSIVVLFITGVLKAKLTIGKWLRSGIEMAAIGIGAAITGFLIGWLFNLFY